MRAACEPLSADEAKEVETAAAAARADKVKAEKAAAAAKVGKGKKTVNVGKQGGSAGLDDYMFDEALDDEVDFM